jgi:hypothetical protein
MGHTIRKNSERNRFLEFLCFLLLSCTPGQGDPMSL